MFAMSCVSNWNLYAYSKQLFKKDTFTHVAYILQGNAVHVYMNGTFDNSLALTSAAALNLDDFVIGYDNVHSCTNGALKHVRWYNYALDAEQVKTDMQSESVILYLGKRKKQFVQDFGNMLNDADTSDIQLLVENTVIHAHRVILKHRSEYFAMLFASGMKEAKDKQLVIESSAGLFSKILYYMYTGEMNLKDQDANVVFAMYQECNKYLLHDAEESCLEYLQHYIRSDVAIAMQLLVQCDKAGHGSLKKQCFASIASKMTTIVENDAVFSLPQHLLHELLKHMAKNKLFHN